MVSRQQRCRKELQRELQAAFVHRMQLIFTNRLSAKIKSELAPKHKKAAHSNEWAALKWNN